MAIERRTVAQVPAKTANAAAMASSQRACCGPAVAAVGSASCASPAWRRELSGRATEGWVGGRWPAGLARHRPRGGTAGGGEYRPREEPAPASPDDAVTQAERGPSRELAALLAGALCELVTPCFANSCGFEVEPGGSWHVACEAGGPWSPLVPRRQPFERRLSSIPCFPSCCGRARRCRLRRQARPSKPSG